jgi:hypothetical protein
VARSDSGRSGAGLSVFALILGLLMLGGAAAAYVLAPRLLSSGGSDTPSVTLSMPQELAGLTLSEDPNFTKQASDRESEFAALYPDAAETAAGVYADASSAGKIVLVVAGSLAVDSPSEQLDSLFTEQAGASVTLQDRADATDAAGPDGTAACAAGTAQNTPLTVCIWADPGSVGVAYFFNRPVEEAEPLFAQFKTGIVS